MPVTAGLPPRHPAVIISLVILILGYCVIAFEHDLRSSGIFPGGVRQLRLFMSIVGLPVWTWIMLSMIGRPDLYLEKPASIAATEDFRRRAGLLSAVGYLLQVSTLIGLLAFLWAWA